MSDIEKKNSSEQKNEITYDWNFLEYPEIAQLNLTKAEFKKHYFTIKEIIEENELCRAIQGQQCINKNNLHTCLKRDDDNKLITSFVVCPKNIKIDKIKNNYILRDFPNELLSIELSTKFFSKILPKNKSILLKNFLILIEKNNFQHGFFIYGDNGIGKTYSCIAFANALALKEKKIAFVFMTELLLKLKNGFNTFNANQELIDNIKKSDVLFLDDFGANHKNFWFYDEYILTILDYRMQNKKPTFFTSNYSLKELQKKLSSNTNDWISVKRIIERVRALVENNEIEIKDKNYRY